MEGYHVIYIEFVYQKSKICYRILNIAKDFVDLAGRVKSEHTVATNAGESDFVADLLRRKDKDKPANDDKI